MKFKLTFTQDSAQIERLIAKGRYPFPCGGIEWTKETIHECDDLTPFYGDASYVFAHGGGKDCIEGVDSRLKVEILEETKLKETYGSNPEATD